MATDFAPAPPPARAPLGPSVGVGGALFATFALGFTEGCLEVERRPIPLRFALRFAAANVLPSAVWSSVPARHVAAASGVPLAALVHEADARSVAVGKRLVLVKSVRAMRLVVGSYGLAWGLWRWHSEDLNRNNNKEEVVQYGESVVRLAPVNSPLSRTSKRKHGEHIVAVPLSSESWKNEKAVGSVEWEKVGIQAEQERVKVVEVELSSAEAAANEAEKMKAKASTSDGTPLCLVGVLPPRGEPLPTSVVDAFDVCFNPLSAALTFIAGSCHDRGVDHVLLVNEERAEEEIDAACLDMGTGCCLSTQQLVTGLLWRHGITVTVLKAEPGEVNDDVQSADYRTESDSGLVVFISKSLRAGHSAARELIEQGLVAPQNACFIVDESLYGQSVPREGLQAQSALLSMGAASEIEEDVGIDAAAEQERGGGDEEQESAATYLSITDLSDQTLQGIRTMVRQGKSSDAIQTAIYQAYGTQRVVAPTRLDQFSDMQV